MNGSHIIFDIIIFIFYVQYMNVPMYRVPIMISLFFVYYVRNRNYFIVIIYTYQWRIVVGANEAVPQGSRL